MTQQDLDDDDLLRRFIVGDISEEERRPIEERMFIDSGYFDSIAALEHEMLIDFARGRLDPRWARPLAAVLDASPDRRRHLDEVKGMLDALPKADGRPTANDRPKSSNTRWYLLAAAAGILVASGVMRWGLVTTVPDSAPQPTFRSYVLEPGPTRSPTETGNSIDLSGATGGIRLVAVLDTAADAVVTARARSIGGDYRPIPGNTTSRRMPNGLEVIWDMPAALWTAGDYLIEYSAGPGAGAGAIIGTRYVRIER